MSDADGWNLNKIAVAVRVSREDMIGYGLVEPTPEEAAKMAEDRRVADERRRASWVVYDAAREALAGIADPVARLMLDLHHSKTIEGPTCEGCDVQGYEAESPEWPCRTVQAIAAHYEIDLPSGWDLWRRPEERP